MKAYGANHRIVKTIQKSQSKEKKILLSAYACEPDKGSEPGIGWKWSVELACLGYEVWVITRANNQEIIEKELAKNPLPNLRFVYYDLPNRVMSWKKKISGGVQIYYLLWQWGAYQVAKNLIKKIHFNLAHHITFGVFRHPSFLACLGIPFILGPLGGGETAPFALRKSYPLKGYLVELVRDMANMLSKIDPVTQHTFKKSHVILCKTKETLSSIPAKYHYKCKIKLEIGIENNSSENKSKQFNYNNKDIRILYVGRLIYLKGLGLGLKAFARLKRVVSMVSLTIIGSGTEEERLRKLALKCGIDAFVEWIPWLNKKELKEAYSHYDIFLFPSLHDSSGNVVLEALASGLAVVCLDLGGPNNIVNERCGRVVNTKGKSEDEVIRGLTDALYVLTNNRIRKKCSEEAIKRANEFQWKNVVGSLYDNMQS